MFPGVRFSNKLPDFRPCYAEERGFFVLVGEIADVPAQDLYFCKCKKQYSHNHNYRQIPETSQNWTLWCLLPTLFKVCSPIREDIFSDHLLWSIFHNIFYYTFTILHGPSICLKCFE